MRPLTVSALALVCLSLLGQGAAAEIRSMAECRARITEDPAMAREEAAQWLTLDGGPEARVCTAETLIALGARTSAAQMLTATADDRNNGLPAASRARLMRDAGRLWLDEDQPRLAMETFTRTIQLTGSDPDTLVLRAEAQGRLGLWQSAMTDLDRALKQDANRADILALRAAARRKSEDPTGGLEDAEAALELQPDLPEALFEKGASLAVLGRMPEALDVWFRLIELDPESQLAKLAQRNMQRLSGN
ncbi:tetratricopeptide repeat protein [Oceanicella sp. SM1341]|uniref:tetratricopeptide repeat protein n=1 Tax=Oceanicella sp. SM1341 TaxID=1548889 RepID=UPI000E4B4912|nr:tetratricopeptide repeat protein [Oceanicella sp. SM1341]